MKKVAIVLVILLLLIAGLPLVGGFKAKSELDRFAAYLDAQPGYNVRLDQYKRGWLNSRGRFILESAPLQALLTDDVTHSIPVELELHHGPIILTDGFALGWFSGTTSLIAEPGSFFASLLAEAVEPRFWHAEFLMDLLGTVHFSDRTAELVFTLDGEVLELSPYAGKGTVTRDGDFYYAGNIAAVSMRDAEAEVLLEDVTIIADLEVNTRAIARDFAPGIIEINVAEASGAGQGVNDFRLRSLSFSMNNGFVEASDSLANFNVGLKFDELALEANLIEGFNVDLSLERISLVFLKRYAEAMAALNSDAGSANVLGLDLLGMVTRELLPSGPQLKLKDFSFQSEKGDLDFHASAYVPVQDGQAMTNPFVIFQALTIEADFIADKALVLALMARSAQDKLRENSPLEQALVDEDQLHAQALEQAATQLDLLLLQGMFVEVDEQITADFEFKNGVATLNGKPMPLPL